MVRTPRIALALMLLIATPSAYAVSLPLVEVTTCGQVVPRRTIGFLSTDLDCTGFTGGPANTTDSDRGAAVYLESKSQLDLRGFTLKGGIHGVRCDALQCRKHSCSKGPCEVFNGTLTGSYLGSIGIAGNRPIVHDVTLSGFTVGIASYTKLALTNATIQNSVSLGVVGRSLTIVNATITGSGQFGINAGTTLGSALRLTNSTVVGNGTASYCDQYPCADFAASRPPRLENTSCDRSFASTIPPGTWHLCTLD